MCTSSFFSTVGCTYGDGFWRKKFRPSPGLQGKARRYEALPAIKHVSSEPNKYPVNNPLHTLHSKSRKFKSFKNPKKFSKAFNSPKRRRKGPVNTSSAHVKPQKKSGNTNLLQLGSLSTLEQVFDRGREIN